MLAIAIVCVIVGVLTYYQIFQQGLFSALIMAVLAMVSAVVALNYFEVLAALLSRIGLQSYAPQSICLVGTFTLCLLGLREATDRLIPGNMNFPMIIDRLGGAFFSLIASLTIAGIIALGFQALPINAKFLYFDRHPNLQDLSESRGLFPNPDRFVASLMGQASNYCFAGATRFAQQHPDFAQELYLNRLALDPGSRRESATDAIKYISGRLVEGNLRDDKGKLIDPRDEVLVRVKIAIKSGSDKKGDSGARDVDGVIRFALGNVRLVGYADPAGAHAAPGLSRYPMGVFAAGSNRVVERLALDAGKFFSTGSPQVEFLFAWPADMNKWPIRFIEFKRSARAKVNIRTPGQEPPPSG